MHDISQQVFDRAEDIADALDMQIGCADALLLVLDQALAAQPDRGRSAYALIGTIRAQAERMAQAARDISVGPRAA